MRVPFAGSEPGRAGPILRAESKPTVIGCERIARRPYTDRRSEFSKRQSFALPTPCDRGFRGREGACSGLRSSDRRWRHTASTAPARSAGERARPREGPATTDCAGRIVTGRPATRSGPRFQGLGFDAYRAGLGGGDPELGAHGNDSDSNAVWSVLNHGGRFTLVAAPEPRSAFASLTAGASLLCASARRRIPRFRRDAREDLP